MSAALARLRVFTSNECCLCGPVKFVARKVAGRLGLPYEEVDIFDAGNESHMDAYKKRIPVVTAGDTLLWEPTPGDTKISQSWLEETLRQRYPDINNNASAGDIHRCR